MNEVQAFKPIHFFQRGGRKIVIPVDDETAQAELNRPATNLPLIHAIARAFYWAKLIDLGIVSSGSEIAIREGLDPSTVPNQQQCNRAQNSSAMLNILKIKNQYANHCTNDCDNRNPQENVHTDSSG
jgi:hypothetical protein